MSAPSPYRPPEAPVADQDRPRGSPVKGMFFGVLVDIGGPLVLEVALIFVWAMVLGASGQDAQAIQEALSRQADPMSGISLVANSLGMVCSFFGGYVCARVARETELRCAAVVAGVGIVFVLLLGADQMTPLLFALVLLGAAIVMLGAWVGARQNAR
jgi:hypothetical protein